jgi:hypothetical protein
MASIDHRLAQGLNKPVLVLSAYNRFYVDHDPYSFTAPGVHVTPLRRPEALFDQLFAGVVGTPAAVLRARASRRSILSMVRGELSRIKAQLPSDERIAFDSHLDGVARVEQTLQAGATAACTPSGRTVVPLTGGLYGETNQRARFRAFADLTAMAFACDLSRIASIQWAGEGTALSWYPTHWRGDMHGLSHTTATTSVASTFANILKDIASEFAYLLDQLEARDAMAATSACWGTPMGWGFSHTSMGTPFVVAAGPQAGLITNRYWRFGTYSIRTQRQQLGLSGGGSEYDSSVGELAHSRLLVTLCQAFGRPDINNLITRPSTASTFDPSMNQPLTQLLS